ncbi:OLC1v1012962C2 [Oldenlandia corymbosa var. corymbosa]|uniref:OLC1v1012962C2 n=1 Tax=Oldenlandia corymbosa var. corymbosa TaxID=529605 RepID=A0AAV1DZ29_OLDCO|nr:OLC1v1012962C2 [Oldenlandia corymbosa var. corymbosa]
MEEEKAAALYDELTRKGEGAARFKRGLGFSSTPNEAVPPSSSFTSSSSFLSQFVKASNPSTTPELDKQSQLSSIQNKLKKNPTNPQTHNLDSNISQRSPRGRSPDVHRRTSRRSHSPEKRSHSQRESRSRSRSRSRDRYRRSRRRSRSKERHSRRSRSRGRDEYNQWRRRSRSKSPRHRRRSRSESPRRRRGDDVNKGRRDKVEKQKIGRVDYAELIEGYDKMTPAEKVKAKMKLQLTETAEKDEKKGMGSGWERFDFDKDAPLDDEEIEAVEDDAALVKRIGQSFRFSSLESKREEELKAAHDEAMFGAPSNSPPTGTDNDEEGTVIQKQALESANVTSLLSEQVLTMQKVSWRDRVSRFDSGVRRK